MNRIPALNCFEIACAAEAVLDFHDGDEDDTQIGDTIKLTGLQVP